MPRSGADDSVDAGDRIVDDHRRLLKLLDRIERSAEPARLAAELQQLRPLLAAHFADEEARDGLHEAIGRSSPHLLPAVQHLFGEHRDLLADLEPLAVRAHELAAGPVAELRTDVAGLVARLRAHEARENDLFSESVYTDVGSQD